MGTLSRTRSEPAITFPVGRRMPDKQVPAHFEASGKFSFGAQVY